MRKKINLCISILVSIICLSGWVIAQETTSDSIDSYKGPGGLAITALDRVGERSIGGYFDTEYVTDLSEDTNTFKAHRLILEFSSKLHKKLLFNSEIEFEYGGFVTNTDDESTIQNGEIKIEQAWFDFELNEKMIQRTGIVLVPFGRVNILHDSDVRDTTDRPLYAKYIVPSTWMDTGFGMHGIFDVNDFEFSYEAYVINGLGDSSSDADDISSSKGIRSARPNFKTDNNGNKSLVTRLRVSPFIGFDVALNYYSGAYNDAGDKNISMLGLDSFYKKGRHELLGEIAFNNIDAETDTQPTDMYGYYIEYHYHTMQSVMKSLFPEFDQPLVTLFGRYGSINTDTETGVITDEYVVGLNFRPTETVVYKLEYLKKEYRNANAQDGDNYINASVAVGF